MSKIPYLSFIALDISGKNYFSWILDAEINLEVGNLGETIKEGNQRSLQVELASRAGESDWVEPTPGQENNRADRAGPDLNLAIISLTQSGPISGQPSPM